MQSTESQNIENLESDSNTNLKKDFRSHFYPDDPPWNWGTAFAVWLISVFLLVAVPSIFVIPYMMNKGINMQNADAMQSFLYSDPVAVLLQVGLVIPIHILTLALSWAVVTKLRKYPFRETLGWQWGGFKIWHIAAIIVAFYLLAYGLVQTFGEQENDLQKLLKSSRTAVYLIAFMATFTAPIVEEVVYRGIIYSAFFKKFGVAVAVIISTLLFAGVHYFQYWGDVTALTMVTLLSLALTMVRVRTGNLLPCIILHTVFNGIQAVGLILEPFFQSQVDKSGGTATILFRFFH